MAGVRAAHQAAVPASPLGPRGRGPGLRPRPFATQRLKQKRPCQRAELSPNSRLGKKVNQGEGAFVPASLTHGSRWGSTTPEAELASGRLLYNWNRYYDPKIGRYITFDPIGIVPGLTPSLLGSSALFTQPVSPWFAMQMLATHGINQPYAYVANNPLRYTDPSGLSPLDCIECYREKEKAHNAIEKCQKELAGCQGNFEKEIEFMEKYKADNYSTAILNCAQINSPEAFDSALKACAKCGLLSGVKPPRTPRF